MPDEVYRPPQSELTRERELPRLAPPAPFSVATAIGDGWRAMVGAFPLWLGIGVVGSALMLASMFTIIGIPLLLPALAWGWFVAGIRMFDGRGSFPDLFEGFSRYGHALGHMIVLGIALFAISLPGAVTQAALEANDRISLGLAVNLAWTLITLRFSLAWMFMVDQGAGPLECIGLSWRYTSGQWGRLILYLLATAGIGMLGVAALVVGIIPATAIISFGYISIYRQVTQTRLEPHGSRRADGRAPPV